MCLEPFGATGLFILGRGVLLLVVGVVIEKEEEEEKGRGERMGRTRTWSAPRNLAAAAALHYQKLEREPSQGRMERKRHIKTGSACSLELRLPNSS